MGQEEIIRLDVSGKLRTNFEAKGGSMETMFEQVSTDSKQVTIEDLRSFVARIGSDVDLDRLQFVFARACEKAAAEQAIEAAAAAAAAAKAASGTDDAGKDCAAASAETGKASADGQKEGEDKKDGAEKKEGEEKKDGEEKKEGTEKKEGEEKK